MLRGQGQEMANLKKQYDNSILLSYTSLSETLHSSRAKSQESGTNARLRSDFKMSTSRVVKDHPSTARDVSFIARSAMYGQSLSSPATVLALVAKPISLSE
jgi:hypothetical protein